MKKLFIIFLFYIPSFCYSQKEINFGFEPCINLSESVESYPLIGLNVYGTYKNYELFLGYNQTELGLRTHNVNGIVAGMKYHFLRDEKISHFVIDFSFQYHKYWESIGTPPLNGSMDFSNTGYSDLITGKTNAKALLLGMGYEFKMNNHFSFLPCIGSGLIQKMTFAPDFGNYSTNPTLTRWYFSPFIKIAIRFYWFKFEDNEKQP